MSGKTYNLDEVTFTMKDADGNDLVMRVPPGGILRAFVEEFTSFGEPPRYEGETEEQYQTRIRATARI